MAATVPETGGLRVTQLRRDPTGGYWTARVSLDGTTIDVDRCDGSWMASVRRAPGHRTFVRREVLPFVAAVLQDRVRRLERQETQS